MNVLKLKEFSDDHVVYLYQPEGRGDYGEVVFRFTDNEASISKIAGDTSNWHANKAIAKVKECVGENNLPIQFTQAWY